MTHPEELLAAYVDGSLTSDERAVVDAHLAGCASCREETELAGRAVRALATLQEEPVPIGVTPIVMDAARRTAPRSRGFAERYQWVAGIAAAACLVLVAAVLGPQLLGGSNEEGAADRAPSAAELESGEDATLGAGGAAIQVEVLDEDLDDRDLRRIAREAAKVAPASPDGSDDAVSLAAPDEALSCLTEGGATFDDRDVLVRVLQADYLGTPAYVAVFHEGPGGGELPVRVVLWVVARQDCINLTFVSQNI